MELLARVLERVRSEPSRTPSVIVTLFGDAILPRGGEVWLGTLLEVFRKLDVGDGVVRTAMSRLAADGWVVRRRVGRNSYYALSEQAERTSVEAERVIYGPLPAFGDATLEMAVEPFDRENLLATGFVQLTPGVLVRPPPPSSPLPLREGSAEGSTQTTLTICGPAHATRALAARLWPLEQTAGLYRRFLSMTAESHVPNGVDGLEALSARVLLVHEWRRVVLRDPRLPRALLPGDWPASAARNACARMYADLLPASEQWLDSQEVGSADAALQQRFAE